MGKLSGPRSFFKKKKHEQVEGLVIFCQEVQRGTLATWGVSLGRRSRIAKCLGRFRT